MIKKAKTPNISECTILSGPNHSQKFLTFGKQYPGRPHNTMIMMPHIKPG